MADLSDFEAGPSRGRSDDQFVLDLDGYEGPIDALLALAREQKVDLTRISILALADQYLAFIARARRLRLELAADYLVMAAWLAYLKSRMLLPRPDPAQEDPGEDPREALMRRLLEHQKFKAAAELLHEREIQRSAQWLRPDGRLSDVIGEVPEPEVEVDLFSLMAAFRHVLERARQRPRVPLPAEQVSIEDRIAQLLARLSETDACGFEELFADVQTRSGMIVTFLALLEMIRLKLVSVFQQGDFGPIRVYKRARPEGAPFAEGDRVKG